LGYCWDFSLETSTLTVSFDLIHARWQLWYTYTLLISLYFKIWGRNKSIKFELNILRILGYCWNVLLETSRQTVCLGLIHACGQLWYTYTLLISLHFKIWGRNKSICIWTQNSQLILGYCLDVLLETSRHTVRFDLIHARWQLG